MIDKSIIGRLVVTWVLTLPATAMISICPSCGGPLIGPHPPLLPGEFYFCAKCEKGFDDEGECKLIIMRRKKEAGK